MTTDQTPYEVPKHEYETVAGTKPHPYVEHEPRTVEHRTVSVADTDLTMMTEIGDGTFVEWTTCRRCSNQVAACKCPEGPQEPAHMAAWREKRFTKELGQRPDPDYPLLPSILEWVTGRGYVVGKADIANGLFVKLFEAAAACEAPEGTQLDDVLVEFQDAYLEATGRTLVYQGEEVVGHTYAVPPGSAPVVVDSLTEAMAEVVEQVKAEAITANPDDGPNEERYYEEPSEDDVAFARETLGPDATEDEVTDLAGQRADRDLKEYDVDF